MTDCTKVMLMRTFRNEKIKNALKCSFFDLEKGEAFSLVHLHMNLVQGTGFSDNCQYILSTCLWFLLTCIIFVYKTISCAVAYGLCNIDYGFLTFGYAFCTIAPLNCKGGA